MTARQAPASLPSGGSGVSSASTSGEALRCVALAAAAQVYQGRGGTLTNAQQGIIVAQARAFEEYLRGEQ